MATLLVGKNVKYGIDNAESFMFLESVSFSAAPEFQEFKDIDGKVCSKFLIDERVSWNMSGKISTNLPQTMKMGAIVTLANSAPDNLWHTKPTAQTCLVTSFEVSMSNSDFQSATIGGEILGFGNENA